MKLTLVCLVFCTLSAFQGASQAQRWQGPIPVAKLRLQDHLVRRNRLDGQLWTAVNQQNNAKVEALLREGASPDSRSPAVYAPQNATVLMEAAALGDEPVVRLLLFHGASIDARGLSLYLSGRGDGDYSNSTALLEACLRDDEAVVKLLVKRGANINAQDNSGTTPLSAAIWKSDWRVAQFLLDYGARSRLAERRLIGAHQKDI